MLRLATIALMVLAAGAPAQAQGAMAWRPAANGQGYGLVLAAPGRAPVFSLACVRGTSEVLAIAYAVKPKPGLQELIVRFDARQVTFVVKPQAMKDGAMVQASAKASPELLASIRTARVVSGAYGDVKLGPYPAPTPVLARTFARRCGPLV
jgi:hypothetical protein